MFLISKAKPSRLGLRAHAHQLSPFLTLQGAVAHCDMPLESGPTLYLPFSQTFTPGYFAYRKPEFAAWFDAHRVQLPLAKGDAAFFNPALFHAAGHNRTSDIRRIGNLLQVSSAYGRAMESVDRANRQSALPCPARRLGHEPPRDRERDRRLGGRLRLPHQPRPRPPDRSTSPRGRRRS